MAPPLKVAEFNIEYGKGVNNVRCVLDLAEEKGIIKKSGSWYSYDEKNIGQGTDKAVEFLASDLDLLNEIKEKIINANV
jgi:recombination protein RecA